MYGLVNQAVRDLVIGRFGEDKWNSICDDAKLPAKDFVSMQYYPDEVTYGLVAASSKKLGLAAEIILKEFGKHWVLFTAKTGYGPIMDLFGRDFKSCLGALNNLHARMGLSMPDLNPPRFTFCEITPNLYTLEYQSKRAGLEPFVEGLLLGLAEKFQAKVEVRFSVENDKRIFAVHVLG